MYKHTHTHARRYFFKEMHMVDWVQLDEEDPDQNDLWSNYVPPMV